MESLNKVDKKLAKVNRDGRDRKRSAIMGDTNNLGGSSGGQNYRQRVMGEDIFRMRSKLMASDTYGNSFGTYSSPRSVGIDGRSFVAGSLGHRVTNLLVASPIVNSGEAIESQTATLAKIGVTEDDDNDVFNVSIEQTGQERVARPTMEGFQRAYLMNKHRASGEISLGEYPEEDISSWTRQTKADAPLGTNSRTPLLSKQRSRTSMNYANAKKPLERDYEMGTVERGEQEKLPKRKGALGFVALVFRCLPAVFLGTLLNILDGLSYGMIMFPTTESSFSGLGPTGLSMFYVSCIVSQLIYSLGWSAFRAGVGSEMIEVTPFFHAMAYSILGEIGTAPEDQKKVLANTITSFAILSLVTGIIFAILGRMKLGALVGFFPRHILVGCIGGVGYFLVITGLEVTSRIRGSFLYNMETLKFMFSDYVIFSRWFTPVLATIALVILERKVHSSLLIPIYYIAVFVIFHFVIYVFPSLSLEKARDTGWLFPSVEDNAPWYSFYELYDFHLIDWWVILKQFYTMLALTFFGILHVPINVPALAISVGNDTYDVDKELLAHGYSNFFSGLVGSIQNYLVYTNSVLFMKAGGDNAIAGILLAIATAGVMMTGPVIIGYIPLTVAGSLIFLLGYELLKEALYDTWGKLRKIEYFTIVTIVIVMGVWDFVYGILVGILLACVSFVIEAARRPVVRGIYTGNVARSNVLRHPKQQNFLKDVGNQICIIKLEGTLFFGSIGGVENVIRSRFEEKKFQEQPIRFLILDMKSVMTIDFSAAERLIRILNLLNEHDVQLIISSVTDDDDTVRALRDARLFEAEAKYSIQLFGSLNHALEWCENSFLVTYKGFLEEQKSTAPNNALSKTYISNTIDPQRYNKHILNVEGTYGTPRSTQVLEAATKSVKDTQDFGAYYYPSPDTPFNK